MQPEKIGLYEVTSELGRGGMATVYRAYDPRFEREVAVKVLPSELLHADPQFRLRFEREAKIIAQLEHSAIVPVYDVGESDGQPYFVMRYMNGGSLSDRIKAGVMDLEEATRILGMVAPALDEAHSRGIIHRDIKPSNILISEKGAAMLTDFDLVGAHDTTGGTHTGTLGTFVYAAPECLDKPQEATARADVYGLGMTTVFCLSGQELSLSTFRQPELAIAKLECSSQLRKVLERAVMWEPDRRFADAAEMVASLRDALDTRIQEEARRQVERQVELLLASSGRSISGRLETIPLPDLLRWLMATRKSGMLIIRLDASTDMTGTICLRKGAPYFAAIGDSSAVDSLKSIYTMLMWPTGTFELAPVGEFSVIEEIQMSTEELLVEGLRQTDELRSLLKQLPPLNAPLAIPTPLAGRLDELTPSELSAFQLVLDHGRLSKVLFHFPGTNVDAANALISLMKREFVVVP